MGEIKYRHVEAQQASIAGTQRWPGAQGDSTFVTQPPENPPSQDAYQAAGTLDRIHNLIDGIESRIFQTQGVPLGKDAVEAPAEPIAVMLCGIRQRAESAEQRLRSLLERL